MTASPMNATPAAASRRSTSSMSSEPIPQRRSSGSTESASSPPILSLVSKLQSPSQIRKKAKPTDELSRSAISSQASPVRSQRSNSSRRRRQESSRGGMG